VGPLRILILVILIYIGYRLLRSSFRKSSGSKQTDRHEPGPSERLTDVLIEDPVCKTLVPKEQAVRLDVDGETIYFCSEECCKKYASDKGDTE